MVEPLPRRARRARARAPSAPAASDARSRGRCRRRPACRRRAGARHGRAPARSRRAVPTSVRITTMFCAALTVRPCRPRMDESASLGSLGRARAGKDVAREPQPVAHLLHAQLAQVARERRLRHRAARRGEHLAELLLGADAPPPDDALDQPLPLRLPQAASLGLHTPQDTSALDTARRGLPKPGHGNLLPMLRKALWMGLYGAIGAAATFVARRTAAGIWRVATGEKPPTKR